MKPLNEYDARRLLKEIFENLDDDNLIFKKSEILEKGFKKPEGTISDFIFFQELSIDEIIEQLQVDDVTYL